jgi:hypothetical protein
MGTKISTMKQDDIFLKQYLHDIRNYKRLTSEMIRNISKMSDEDKMTIILLYDSMMANLTDSFMNEIVSME